MLTKRNNSLMSPSSYLIDELFGDLFAPINKFKHQTFGPATNVIENENEIQMQIVVPGVSKEQIKLEVDNNILTISLDKSHQSAIDSESYLRREFEISNFTRNFTLSDNIDKNSISSKLENGILNINLPKLKGSQPKSKTIDIQ